jgi:lysophospholipid acyltransferase (LPLAT)-like uncharacterized protein
VLEKFILPMAIIPLRLLIRTWRTRRPEDALLRQITAPPRVIIATYHGMLLHFLAYADLLSPYGRRVVVMLSPSLDGRLLAATLERFGIAHVRGTTGSRAVAGSLEFIRRVEAGDVGLIAADGPGGPCCVAKDGVVRIAAAAAAHVVVATTAASCGHTFGSWDRAHVPAPFARVELAVRLLPPPAGEDDARALTALQAALLDTARAIDSPVLPPALREAIPRR